jgi:cbb3-type cytochrome oxidase maturation protein
MSILFLLLPLMLAVAGGAVVGFVWAARVGQLDDLDTPPLRMLGDDER